MQHCKYNSLKSESPFLIYRFTKLSCQINFFLQTQRNFQEWIQTPRVTSSVALFEVSRTSVGADAQEEEVCKFMVLELAQLQGV